MKLTQAEKERKAREWQAFLENDRKRHERFIILHAENIDRIREHAKAHGETIPQFVNRAVIQVLEQENPQ